MDALRRAEQAKRLATPGSRAEAVAGELSLDPLETTPAPPDSIRCRRSPGTSTRSTPIWPPRSDGFVVAAARASNPVGKAPADNGSSRSGRTRRAARNVFAAKPVPASRTPLWLFLGLLGLATLAIVGYFWWQLQSVGRGSLSAPAGDRHCRLAASDPRRLAPSGQPRPQHDAAGGGGSTSPVVPPADSDRGVAIAAGSVRRRSLHVGVPSRAGREPAECSGSGSRQASSV
jgi:hypothetical protein